MALLGCGGQNLRNREKVVPNDLISFEWAVNGITAQADVFFEAINPEMTSVKIVEDGWSLNKQGVARALGQTQG